MRQRFLRRARPACQVVQFKLTCGESIRLSNRGKKTFQQLKMPTGLLFEDAIDGHNGHTDSDKLIMLF